MTLGGPGKTRFSGVYACYKPRLGGGRYLTSTPLTLEAMRA